MLSSLIKKIQNEAVAESARRSNKDGNNFGKIMPPDQTSQHRLRQDTTNQMAEVPIFHPRSLKRILKQSEHRYHSGEANKVLLTATQAEQERKRRGWKLRE